MIWIYLYNFYRRKPTEVRYTNSMLAIPNFQLQFCLLLILISKQRDIEAIPLIKKLYQLRKISHIQKIIINEIFIFIIIGICGIIVFRIFAFGSFCRNYRFLGNALLHNIRIFKNCIYLLSDNFSDSVKEVFTAFFIFGK